MPKEVTDDRGASGTAGIDSEEEFTFAFDEAEESGDSTADPNAAAGDNTDVNLDNDNPDDNDAAGVAGTSGVSDDDASDNGTAGPGSDDDDGAAGTAGSDTSTDDDDKYEQRYRTLQGIHKHDKDNWEQEKAQLQSEIDQLKKPEPDGDDDTDESGKSKKLSQASQDFVDSLTEDQKEQLKDYDKEFETISKMEGIKRTVALNELRKEIDGWKQGVLDKLTEHDTKLNPIVEWSAGVEEDVHFQMIEDAHTDYEQYRDDGSITKWIASKPKYLRDALTEVYEQGEAKDVIDLISDFKTENNIQDASDDSGDNADADQDLLEEQKKKKADKKRALASVKTRKNAVNLNQAPADDYDSAFEEAAQDRRL